MFGTLQHRLSTITGSFKPSTGFEARFHPYLRTTKSYKQCAPAMYSAFPIAVLCTALFSYPAYSFQPRHVAPPDLIHRLIAEAKERPRNTADETVLTDDDTHILSSVHQRSGENSGPIPKETPDMIPEESPNMMEREMSNEEMKKVWRKRLLKLICKEMHAFDENGKKECNAAKTMTPDSGVGIVSDYVGPAENMTYYDKSFGFLKYAMGFSAEQVMESKKVALKHFKVQFGIDFDLNKAYFIEDNGIYYDSRTRLALVPFMDSYHCRVIMHSLMPIKCANITGVTGGWMLVKSDGLKLYGNYGGPEGVEHEGTVVLMNFFTSFLHATRKSSRFGFYAMAPMLGKEDGYSPISGIIYNFDDDEMGWMDGVSIKQETKMKDEVSITTRGVAMFPGRFTPVSKYDDNDYGYAKGLDK